MSSVLQYNASNNDISQAPPYANIYIGAVIFVIGVVGTTINIHNVLLFIYAKTYHNAYGYLCLARGICNVVNLLVFVVYAAPNTIFMKSITPRKYIKLLSGLLPDGDNVGRILGLISAVGYATIPILQLGTAYNRVIAIFIPLRYNQICSKEWALIVIFCGLIYGVATTVDDIAENCLFIYDRSQFSWNYVNCSTTVQNYKLIYPILLISALTLSTNLITAAKLFAETLGNRRNFGRNTKLFWQSFIQEMFFANDLVWQNYLSNLVDSILWHFISQTLMWELAHTFDGAILLLFDARLRKPLSSLFQKNSCSLRVEGANTFTKPHTIRDHVVTQCEG